MIWIPFGIYAIDHVSFDLFIDIHGHAVKFLAEILVN